MPGSALPAVSLPDRAEAWPAHGGALAAARRRYPDAPEPWLDLSTGINPVAYPLPALPEAAFARLPEPDDLAALEATAAGAYGVADACHVVAAPGTQALIGLLPWLHPAARVAIVAPTYAEHAACWRATGAAVENAAAPDPSWLAARPDIGALVVCNPNNPDGRRHDPAALLAAADLLARRGGLLVVDEAFADFAPPGLSLATSVPQAGLVVLRSFGKAYGLAGVRLGFALAPPALAERLRAALGPWPVGGPAITVGRVALADTAWRAAATARLAAMAAALDARMAAAGITPAGGTALFRLYEGAAAGALADRLGRAGILVRRFAERPEWLRCGLPGTAAELARLDAALG